MKIVKFKTQERIENQIETVQISYRIFNQFLFQYHNKKTRPSALSNLFKSLENNSYKISEPYVSLVLSLSISFSKSHDKAWPWKKEKTIVDALSKFTNSLDL